MRATLLVCLLVVSPVLALILFPTPVLASVEVSPTSLPFGSVTVNTNSTSATVSITNSGRQSFSVYQISSNRPEFVVSGVTLPFTVHAHSSVSFHVTFRPDAAATYTGSVFVKAQVHNGSRTIAVSGTGIASSVPPPATYLLSPSPNSLSFGSLLLGASASLPLSVTNSGTGSVTISQVATSNTAFAVSGFSGSVALAPGQSLAFSVSFAPSVTGSASGNVSVMSTATNSPATIALSGTGIQPQISVVPSSVSFGSVTTGVTNTQTLKITNPGTANLTVTQASMTSSAFTYSGLTLPLTIAPGGSSSFTASFAPASAGTFAGNLTLVNNSPTPALAVVLSGTGLAAVRQLSASPSSVTFGNVATGTSTSQSVTLTNTGNSSVSLSQDGVTGTGFTMNGLGLPLTLAAGQSTSLTVGFSPTSAGSVTGTVSISSNATNSPTSIPLSGTGTAPASYSVSLSWTPSSSSYSGFNVYRSTASGGPYNRIDTSMVSTTSYTDPNVTTGQTYYYVATEVDTTGMESNYSSEVSATIP